MTRKYLQPITKLSEENFMKIIQEMECYVKDSTKGKEATTVITSDDEEAMDFFNFHWQVHFLLVIKVIGLTISIFLSHLLYVPVIPCVCFWLFCVHSGGLIIPTVYFLPAVCISHHSHKLTFCLSCYTWLQTLLLCWPFLIFGSLCISTVVLFLFAILSSITVSVFNLFMSLILLCSFVSVSCNFSIFIV